MISKSSLLSNRKSFNDIENLNFTIKSIVIKPIQYEIALALAAPIPWYFGTRIKLSTSAAVTIITVQYEKYCGYPNPDIPEAIILKVASNTTLGRRIISGQIAPLKSLPNRRGINNGETTAIPIANSIEAENATLVTRCVKNHPSSFLPPVTVE